MAKRKSVMTPKKEKLVEALADGMSIAKASEVAGYATDSGAYHALRDQELREHLALARSELKDATKLKRIDIIEGMLDAIQHAKMCSDPGTMIRGYAEIAKMLGFYEPEKKILEVTTNQGRIRQKFEIMSDEELLEIMDGTVIEGESHVVN